MAKVYGVSYDTGKDYNETIAYFSTQAKAEKFIQDAKQVFRKDEIVRCDYRHLELTWEEYDLDEYDNILF